MAAFTFPSSAGTPAVGSVSAAGYIGPASGFNAFKAAQTSSAIFNQTPGGTPAATPAPDTALLTNITADINSLKATGAQNQAAADAANIQAQGYGKEEEAYQNVGAIAAENATIAGVSGDIQRLQANRVVDRTIGSQRAAVAAAGFASSGDALDLMKSSIQEGYRNDQIIRTQTSLTQGGYLEEGAASQAEASGARFASDAALSLSKSEAAAGQLALANATNETAALQTYLSTRGSDPVSNLVTSTLGSDPNAPTVLPTSGANATDPTKAFGAYTGGFNFAAAGVKG
jgi:hypothetical protein